MKKVINFDKEINFPTMIGEITSISLNPSLEFISDSDIEGNFTIKSTYKMTEASHLEEDFECNIPVSITLSENLDRETCKIEIEDFYYEIINDDTLRCEIDVLVEGIEKIDVIEVEEIKEETAEEEVVVEEETSLRECDADEKCEEETYTEETIEIEEDINENIETIFSAFRDTEETFATYSVYIMRKNDTLDKIFDLYNITKEELANYNDLEKIEIGTKIIIPTGKVKTSE
jgi:LysM repeat protein